MAQVTDRNIGANPTGFDMRTEINNIIAALESDNSGSSEPLNTVAYMKWVDTSNATYYYVKERNHDNTAWVTLFRYTVATKIMEAVSNGVVLDDSTVVHKTGDETIAGVKTFSSSPIVPTPTANTQAANKAYADLKVALADFTGTNVSFSINGYQKLPSGLIIQWGTTAGTTDSNGNFQIVYPIAFPNLNLSCVFSLGDKIASVASSSVSLSNNISVFGKNSMNINATTYNNINYSLSSLRINWLVIGY